MTVQLDAVTAVPVASIAGLAITKLLAWRDRGLQNAKDASDFRSLLELYASAGNADRIYADADLLARHAYDLDIAGAELLGSDIQAIAASASHTQLAFIFLDANQQERLLVNMLKGAFMEALQVTRLESMIAAFAKGLLD